MDALPFALVGFLPSESRRMMHPFSLVGRALRLASALTLVPAVLAAQGDAGTLAGRVRRPSAPVAGATVLAGGAPRPRAPTAATGSRSQPGRYLVRVRAIGFNTVSDSVTIRSGATTTANLHPRRAPSRRSRRCPPSARAARPAR